MRFLRSDMDERRSGYYRFKLAYGGMCKEGRTVDKFNHGRCGRCKKQRQIFLSRDWSNDYDSLYIGGPCVDIDYPIHSRSMILKCIDRIPLKVYIRDILRGHATALTIRNLGLKSLKVRRK